MTHTHSSRTGISRFGPHALVGVLLTVLLAACLGAKPELTLTIAKPTADQATNTNVPITLEIPGRTPDQFTALNVFLERKRATDPDTAYTTIKPFDRTSPYPFTATWDIKSEADGAYVLRARATYSGGGFSSDTFTTISDPRKITLNRQAPKVTLAGLASVTSETTLKLTATVTPTIDPAQNPGSAITKVELYDGPNKLDEKTVAPYVFEVKFVVGNKFQKQFKAKAYDQVGATGESSVLAVDVNIAVPDTTLPTVVSVDPPNGATGKSNTQLITVTFSEPMNQVATQAAYQSADLPASAVTFTWSADGKVMMVKPNALLEYRVVLSPSDAAKSYSFAVTNTATDLVGNKLAVLNSSFSTLKQVTTVFSSDDARTGSALGGRVSFTCPDVCVGDTAENVDIRGFITFDLSSLSTDINTNNILSANLGFSYKSVAGKIGCDFGGSSNGDPSFKSNSFYVENVFFDSLNDLSYDLRVENLVNIYKRAAIECVVNSNFVYPDGTLNNKVDTRSAVLDYWNNRESRKNVLQYRFRFDRQTNTNGVADYISFVKFGSGSPILEVTYLMP
jgi:Bacterial Ig-like domain